MNVSSRGLRWSAVLLSLAVLGACALPEDETGSQPSTSSSAPDEARPGDLSVSLSAAKTAFGATDAAQVTVTLTNVSDRSVRLLRWFTPADGIEEPIFAITRDGEQVAFIGPHYKRAPATDADFLVLAPGASLTATVDLAEVYDLSVTGAYAIRYDVEAGALRGDKLAASAKIGSPEFTVWIEGRQAPDTGAKPGDGGGAVGNISFSGRCDATQQSTLLQAVDAAKVMSDGSVSYLNGTPGATPRYTTWFGAYTSARWSQARTQFVAIQDGFYNKPVTLDCSCKKSYYAYVYPTRPYQIFVCRAFWQAPMTGTDSKGGTLIHEMSHFDVVAGTDDWVYGQAGAKDLASTDPAKALNNADNHEYFAENTPFLQ